ncbi:MAG: N-acetyltransferase [Rhodobacterales bacterium]
MTHIRKAEKQDHPAIWAILKPIFRAGETYALDPDISQSDALAFWCGGTHTSFVAEQSGRIIGSYYICPNQGGNGGHICNCGFATHEQAQGKGSARAMLEHSLSIAPKMGFSAMQFNFVLGNNNRAVSIWQKYGFKIIGRIPQAFNHPKDGYVDALVMYKSV